MDKEKIQIIQTQLPQAGVQRLLDASVECAPQLRGHKEVFALGLSSSNGILDALADFIFVLVAAGAIDMTISRSNGMVDSPFDFTRSRLPGS